MTNTRKSIFRGLFAGTMVLLTLTGVIAGTAMRENRIENQFPKWEKVSDTEDRGFESNPDVEMRFTGIDFDVELHNGRHADMVLVDVNVNTPDGAGFQYCQAIDYLYKGEWYNVYYLNTGTASAPGVRGNFHDIVEFPVPCGLFAKDGTYRMFIDGFGSFDIDLSTK